MGTIKFSELIADRSGLNYKIAPVPRGNEAFWLKYD